MKGGLWTVGSRGEGRGCFIIAGLSSCSGTDRINFTSYNGIQHLQRPVLLRKNERSLCQDYQTVFIYSTIACCLGDQCNPSAPPPHPLFPGSPFPFSPPLSDWRLYWLVPLSWPSDGHSSCQEMEINLRQSALKPIDFS